MMKVFIADYDVMNVCHTCPMPPYLSMYRLFLSKRAEENNPER